MSKVLFCVECNTILAEDLAYYCTNQKCSRFGLWSQYGLNESPTNSKVVKPNKKGK